MQQILRHKPQNNATVNSQIISYFNEALDISMS